MQRIVNILTKTRGSKTFAYALSYVSQIKNVSSIRYFCLDEYRLGSRKILKNLFVKRRKSIIVSKLVFACINKCKPTRYTHKMHYKSNIVKCRDLSLSPLYCHIETVFPLVYRDKSMHIFLHVSSAFICIKWCFSL